jgi:hypothetical protein
MVNYRPRSGKQTTCNGILTSLPLLLFLLLPLQLLDLPSLPSVLISCKKRRGLEASEKNSKSENLKRDT